VNESEVKVELNGSNVFRMSWFGFPNVAFSDLAERSIARAQDDCAKIKGISEDMADTLLEICSSNASGARDYGLRLIEMSKLNTASAIDFASHLLGSKSMSDVLSLSAAEARRMFENATAQNRELWELAKEAGEPVRKQAAKVFLRAS
jgi:phasin